MSEALTPHKFIALKASELKAKSDLHEWRQRADHLVMLVRRVGVYDVPDDLLQAMLDTLAPIATPSPSDSDG